MTYTLDDEPIVVKKLEGDNNRSSFSGNPTKEENVPGLATSTEGSDASLPSSSHLGHSLQYQSSKTASSLTTCSDEAESSDLIVGASADPFASFSNGERLVLPEWDNEDNFRAKWGWQGHDLVHSIHSAVRVLDYYCQYGAGTDIVCAILPETNAASVSQVSGCRMDGHDAATIAAQETKSDDISTVSYAAPSRGGKGTVLTGFVHFTKQAESHQGYCHGGAACSIMDDVLGYTAFCVTGQVLPWSGYTVQINTQLLRPIPVNSFVYVSGTITSVVRRKVYVSAELYQVPNTPSNREERVVYATCEGIVVLNKGILRVLEAPAFHA
jgi:acyl-coenzyme A thioesterase PaaI-like protein